MIDHINLSAHNHEADESDKYQVPDEIQLLQNVPVSAPPFRFELSEGGNMLHVYNATRVIKILNASGKVVLIQTAAKNSEPTVFNLKKLKKGKYAIQTGSRQYTFLRK